MITRLYAVLILSFAATLSYAEPLEFEPNAYLKIEEGMAENDYNKTLIGISHCLGVMYLASEAGFVENPQDQDKRFHKAARGLIGLGVMMDINNSGYTEDGKTDQEVKDHTMETIFKVRQEGINAAIAYDDQLDDVVVDGTVNFFHPFFGELEYCIMVGNQSNVIESFD